MISHSKKLLPLVVAIAGTPSFAQQEDGGAGDPDRLMDEIIVHGVRNAELNAREAERNKDNFSSVITTDDAGNFADQNVAESLQRLPGITLQRSEGEGRFINLRGLGPGFTSVQMNGSEVANGSGGANDDEGRGFSLDSLSADVLQSIEVNKTLTPDMDLNSIGGSVNVKTVSALDRGQNKLKTKAQGIYQDLGGDTSPKLTLQGTNTFADDTIGVAYSLSWENRKTEGYETFTHDSSLPRLITVDDQSMIIPWELQNRQENAERERIGANIDLEYRPSEFASYFARYSRTEYTDDDVAFREYYRFAQAGDDEVVYLDPGNNIFGLGGGDLQHQAFIQEGTSTTEVYSLGGENLFGDGWTLDYELARSRSNLDSPDGRRAQFRNRDITMLGQSGPEYVNGQVVAPGQLAELAGLDTVPGTGGFGPSGYQPGEVTQPFMLYDNIFIEDSFREDTIDQFSVDLQKSFGGDRLNYLQVGAKIKQRARDRDKDRASLVPGDKAILGCAGDLDCVAAAGSVLGDFGTGVPDHPAFDHALITVGATEQLLAATRAIADNYDPENAEVESTRRDYDISEDAQAAYLMGEFKLSDSSALIAGVRYESTDFNATGNLSIRNDREESADQLESFDIAIPLADTHHSYDGFFPSLHYRNELTDTLLLRASVWTSFARPDFDQARSRFEVTDRVIFCNNDPAANLGEDNCSDQPADLQGDLADDVYTDEYKAANLEMAPDNSVTIGNPRLEPMTSNNVDLSLSWYASDNLFLQGAVFYKDIDDFIVRASGVDMAIDDLPFAVPVDQVDRFVIPADLLLTNVDTFLNGDSAEVYGVELSHSHYFTEQHGWLNHFLIQSNVTWLHSEADVGGTVRAGKIQLPEQADWTVNATLGWENDIVSVRLIGNYQGKILKRIGACTAADIAADAQVGLPANCRDWADVYQDESTIVDFRASYRATSNTKLFFDATNITGETAYRYFDGNAFTGGNMLFRAEDYGSTYQLGLTVDFY
ncbi:MAG: TonB-dependent receptor [Woeseiaceae bacterium]